MRTETAAPTKEKHMETTENVPQIFNFNGREVRTLRDPEDNVLFNVNDVCEFLEFSNSRDALANHVDEDDVARRDVIDSMGRNQVSNFVTEFGLYDLILGSRKKEAKEFKRWVTHEVLPSIRKNGYYALESKLSLCHKEIARLMDAKATERVRVTQPARLAEAKTEALAHKKEIKTLEADAAASVAYAASMRANDAVVENEELRKLKRHLQAELRQKDELVAFLQRKLQEAYSAEVG